MARICSDIDCNSTKISVESLYKELIYTDDKGCPGLLVSNSASAHSCQDVPAVDCNNQFSIEDIFKMIYSNNGMLVAETDFAEARITDCNDNPDLQTLLNESLAVESVSGNDCYSLRVYITPPMSNCTDTECNEITLEEKIKQAFVKDSNGCTALIVAETELLDVKFFSCNSWHSLETLVFQLLVETASFGILVATALWANGGCDQPVLAEGAIVCADNGLENGELTVSATGGTSPYIYTLDGLVAQVDDGHFINVGAGTHEVTITDSLACDGEPLTVVVPECGFQAEITPFMTQMEILDEDNYLLFEGTAQEVSGSQFWDIFNAAVVMAKAAGVFAKLAMWLPMRGGASSRHRVDVITPSDVITEQGPGWTHDAFGSKTTGGLSSFWVSPKTTDQYMPDKTRCAIFVYNSENLGATNSIPIGATSPANNRMMQINLAYAGNGIIGTLGSLLATIGIVNNLRFHTLIRTTTSAIRYRFNKTANASNTIASGTGNGTCMVMIFGRNPPTCTGFSDVGCINRLSGVALFNQDLTNAQSDAWEDINEYIATQLNVFV